MSRSVKSGLLALAACALALSPAGCARWAPKVWVQDQRQLDLPTPFTKLDVQTHNGSITVNGADDTTAVKVTARIRAGASSQEAAEECLKAIELTSTTERSTHKLGWKYASLPASDWNAEIAFDVTMPRGIELAATTHNGAITVRGMDAACSLTTHNGQIKAETGAEPLVAETHNGAIDARSKATRVQLTTHNGSVELALGSVGAVAGGITTFNGAIQLALGDSVATDLSCDTSNGRITVDMPWQAQETRTSHVHGRIGAGGGTFKAETHNGSITVTRAKP